MSRAAIIITDTKVVEDLRLVCALAELATKSKKFDTLDNRRAIMRVRDQIELALEES